jgi:nucleotide-binding universal stress UspA family protein
VERREGGEPGEQQRRQGPDAGKRDHAPGREMTARLRRILVGVDGSDNGRRALEWAILLARQSRAEVLAVHAIGLLAHLGPGPAVPSHAHLQELRYAFETEWCAPLRQSEIAYRLLLVDGAPVHVLLSVATSETIDVIVVGSRGAGGFPELLLGSTSHQLAQHATCPVLIVPPDSSP